jgi:hypothetical protein
MSDRIIQDSVQKLAGVLLADQVFLVEAEVTAVDIPSRTCTVVTTSGQSIAELQNVRLMPVVDDGVLIVPTVGSSILVGHSKRIEPFVCQFSQVDQVIIISGTSKIDIQDGAIQLNDGSYGGLVEVQPLVAKINRLENLVKQFIVTFNAHTHPASSGTTSPTLTSQTDSISNLTQQSDLENTTIKHGS